MQKSPLSILFSLIALLIGGVILTHCSTEKDAFLNRSYHDVTAKYNGYFNANELINESLFQFRESREENYYEIIPVYQYPNSDESKGLYAPMDTAAAKCEIVIGRHSMPKKKVGRYSKSEWCSWIDDNWITIGWSQFYKRDFESAMEKFEYIEKQYTKNDIVYSAKFWKAKTLIEIEDYFSAEEILLKLIEKKNELDELEKEEKLNLKKIKEKLSSSKKKKRKKKKKKDDDEKIAGFPKGLENQIYPTLADLYIRTKEYNKAIDALNKAISLKQKREFKTRLIFILAQIYHELKNNAASALYEEVVKRNPDYEMAFQAKINRALAFSGSDNKSIKNQLLKMLKDDKNIDFFDQIYYALAEIALKEDNRLKGIEYLELSIESSVNNAYQKTTSLIRLADLYYLERNYRKANEYFETTMNVIPKEHEQYQLIKAKNKNLADLIQQLNTIQHSDSIINLCELPEKEVLALIKDIIDKKREELEKKQEQKELDALFASNDFGKTGSPGTSRQLFIWDQNLRGLGFNEFKKIWGDIKLEDNWRRSNKNASSLDLEVSSTNDSLLQKELSIDFYLDQLPCGDEQQLSALKDSLMNALYKAGNIYLHKLDDPEESISMYKRVSAEFLPNEKAIAGLYQLYIIFKEKNKLAESNSYKSTIVNDYKNSEYAKLILNPNYKEGQRLQQQQEAIDYALTYQQYKNNAFHKVIEACSEIIKNDTLNSFYCKYCYLNALSFGHLAYDTSYKKLFELALSKTVKECKGSEYYQPAKNLLNRLRNEQSLEAAKAGKSSFIFDNTAPHKFVVFFPKDAGNINSIKNKLSNLNKSSFSKSSLKTSNQFLNSEDQMIIVQSFVNVSSAMDYYDAIRLNKGALKTLFKDFSCFTISEKNLSVLYLEKNLESYLTFFNANYLE